MDVLLIGVERSAVDGVRIRLNEASRRPSSTYVLSVVVSVTVPVP